MPHIWYVHKCPDWGNSSRKNGWWAKLIMPEYGEPGFYQQARSFSAFFHCWNKSLQAAINKHGTNSPQALKHKVNHVDGYFFMSRDEDDFEFQKKAMVQSGADAKKVEEGHRIIATFNTIWEFYDYIGFNYKTRKYTDAPREKGTDVVRS